MKFPCNRCGLCCRNLQFSDLYADLDRGDGVCKHLKENLCSIYSERPLKCRIDDCYDLLFKDIMPREEYYRINEAIYKKLQNNELENCEFMKKESIE